MIARELNYFGHYPYLSTPAGLQVGRHASMGTRRAALQISQICHNLLCSVPDLELSRAHAADAIDAHEVTS